MGARDSFVKLALHWGDPAVLGQLLLAWFTMAVVTALSALMIITGIWVSMH